jgi:hypothetical protein
MHQQQLNDFQMKVDPMLTIKHATDRIRGARIDRYDSVNSDEHQRKLITTSQTFKSLTALQKPSIKSLRLP